MLRAEIQSISVEIITINMYKSICTVYIYNNFNILLKSIKAGYMKTNYFLNMVHLDKHNWSR